MSLHNKHNFPDKGNNLDVIKIIMYVLITFKVSHTTGQGWSGLPGSYLKRIIPSTDTNADSQRLPAGVGKGPPRQLDMLALTKERQKYTQQNKGLKT